MMSEMMSNYNARDSYKDEDSEEIVKLKESVCSKKKEIGSLEKLLNEKKEKLKKYKDDLIDLIIQIEGKNKKIISLEERNSELQGEKTKVNKQLVKGEQDKN